MKPTPPSVAPRPERIGGSGTFTATIGSADCDMAEPASAAFAQPSTAQRSHSIRPRPPIWAPKKFVELRTL
jgi:hypothetical protein